MTSDPAQNEGVWPRARQTSLTARPGGKMGSAGARSLSPLAVSSETSFGFLAGIFSDPARAVIFVGAGCVVVLIGALMAINP